MTYSKVPDISRFSRQVLTLVIILAQLLFLSVIIKFLLLNYAVLKSIFFILPFHTRLADGRILDVSCQCSSVCLLQCFENEQTNFDASWYSGPDGKDMIWSTLGVRRSKFKVTRSQR